MRQLFSKKAVALLIGLISVVSLSGQAIKDIRINELLVKNVDSYEDDYGHRVGWIELFNSGYTMVDVGGAHIKVRGKEYRIPKNDQRTQIAPQGYLVFFAEGTASKGTFHTNFTLDETDYVAFYDQSGRGRAIDSVSYRYEDMRPDVSIGWYENHDGQLIFGELDAVTPYATNDTIEKVPRSEHFRQADPWGIVMTLTAVSVVFVALIVLYLVFKMIGKILMGRARRKEEKNNPAVVVAAETTSGKKKDFGELKGEELAAIAMALYKYSQDLHDIENTVLTINRAAKAYSPWSSKIYGLRQLPNKK